MGIEDTENVLGTVVAAGRDLLKALRSKPSINFRQRNRNDVKPGLGGDDAQIGLGLVDEIFETV